MQAFQGAPLARLLDPRRVHPAALAELERQAGGSLLTSSYLRRHDAIRILAVLASRAVTDPAGADRHQAELQAWVTNLGDDSSHAAARPQAAA
jgi:hypothetical protein